MLLKADIEELVRVVMEAFPPEQMILMFSEEDLAMFFMNTELKRVDIMEQLYALPPEMMQKFVEGVTGKPSEQTNTADLFKTIESLPDDQFRKFMASIDPQVQRYVTYQTTKKNPDYFLLFPKMSYVKMMSTLMKPDMVKSMVMLNKESLMYMVAELPPDLLSIVAAQVDPTKLATFLQDGHMDLLEGAWMV
jgi:hypothetical protein